MITPGHRETEAAGVVERPMVAISMGDPAGVGPEVVLKSLTEARVHDAARCLVVGDVEWLQALVQQLQLPLQVKRVSDPAQGVFQPGVANVLDVHRVDRAKIQVGRVSAAAGEAAVQAIRGAVGLAMQGRADAIATAPINKEAMHLAGYLYPGHTEMLAELTGTREFSMLLATPTLRVFFVTVHVSLRQAVDLITSERVLATIKVAHRTLKQMGFTTPRLAIAGLNPHAGEGGLFGNEDSTRIAPAVRQARASGMEASGPWPPDSVFVRARSGEFDAVVAMYHDQGHIPVKLLDFQGGVNVTAGLPIIRTSADHGTAFDIAGKGIADHGSMTQAILLASQLATTGMAQQNR